MLPNNEFLSYQPYLELNNKYQSYMPIQRNPIRDIVWEVYEVDDFDLEKTIALPDVCADIMTFYTKDNAFGYFMGGSISLQQMRELEFMKDVNSIFGVRLRTGMLGNLFRCDVKDINDSRVAMSDALWNGREIEEHMMKADNFVERWEIMSFTPQKNETKKFEYAREHSDDGTFFILTRENTYPHICFFKDKKPYYCWGANQDELSMEPLENYLKP